MQPLFDTHRRCFSYDSIFILLWFKCILVEVALLHQDTSNRGKDEEYSNNPTREIETVKSSINQSQSHMYRAGQLDDNDGSKARQLNNKRKSFSETDLLYEIDRALVLARDFLYSKGKNHCCLLVFLVLPAISTN